MMPTRYASVCLSGGKCITTNVLFEKDFGQFMKFSYE